MTDESWGPWIEHDGKGCPCKGEFVESEERSGRVSQHIAGGLSLDEYGNAYTRTRGKSNFACWFWGGIAPAHLEVIRYRIRKPKGLTILEGIIREAERTPDLVGVDA